MYVSMTRSGNIGATGPTGPTGPEGGNEKADNVFRITDNGDSSKKIAFEASSIATSTVRTITMPNTDVTLVSSGGIVNADINASAAIAQSKLVDVVNADVDASAAIATSKLSGAVTSIASHGLGALATLGSVDTGQIANNAVGLAQMAGGTDGNLITYDASGDPAHVVTGNSGQVLTSNGAGAAPTFQTAVTGATNGFAIAMAVAL